MSAPVSAIHGSTEIKATPKTVGRSSDFHPSIWRDHFLIYTSESPAIDVNMEQNVGKMKDEVKRMFDVAAPNPSETLQLIDAIQRLGFAYHFENEITEKLKEINKITLEEFNDDPHIISLWFRLLRQEGYNVSCGIFHKFTNKEGKFDNTLVNNVEGMLSLYEAAHLMANGEPILEEALAFTTTHLKSSTTSSQLSPFLAAQVKHALKQPIRKGLLRVEARHYISIYEENPSHSEVLLNFAKLDFNILQKLHQKELSAITRLAEAYFWICGVYFEPQYALGRRITTKVLAVTSLLDDIYDVKGTFEELQLFTDAVHRWNISCLDPLPEYMKYCYRVLLELYEEIEELTVNEERGLYRIHCAKEAMKKHVQAYFDEANWLNKNYIPTVEEHMKVTAVSGGYCMFTITSFLGMGDIAKDEAFEWASKYPKIIVAASVICRLMDDITGHKFEQERGEVASSVECYVKQYNVSEEEAYRVLGKQIFDAWKDINEECLEPRDMPMPLLLRVLNLARVMDVLYKDGSSYGGLVDFTSVLKMIS
ncbi:(-)-germacrene D synthase [Morus notabilis]|uniref:(-)-germacrene D synthase n=1 Tax=Morus notabilis TaxID=981085 RepID=W9SEK2_9ROSA|nr:(-)-germacrene D synthase [Morus notabilis]